MRQGMAHIGRAQVKEGMDLIDEATVAAVAASSRPRDRDRLLLHDRRASISPIIAGRANGRKRRGDVCVSRSTDSRPLPSAPGRDHAVARRVRRGRDRGATSRPRADGVRRSPVSAVGFREIGRSVCVWATSTLRTKFAMAHQRGNDAQPGLALLQLARGQFVAARSSIRGRWRNSRWPSQEPGCSRRRSRSRSRPTMRQRRVQRLRSSARSPRATTRPASERAPGAGKRPHVRRRCRRGHQGTPPGHQIVDGGRPAVRDRLGPPMPGERAPAGRR